MSRTGRIPVDDAPVEETITKWQCEAPSKPLDLTAYDLGAKHDGPVKMQKRGPLNGGLLRIGDCADVDVVSDYHVLFVVPRWRWCSRTE